MTDTPTPGALAAFAVATIIAVAVLGGVLLVGVTPALGQSPFSAGDLATRCERVFDPRTTGGYDAAYCVGYFHGYAARQEAVAYDFGNASRICIPTGVTLEQMIRIFLQRVDASPETRHVAASYTIDVIFTSVFPCR